MSSRNRFFRMREMGSIGAFRGSFIVALTLLLCSCATESWVTKNVQQKFNSYKNKELKRVDAIVAQWDAATSDLTNMAEPRHSEYDALLKSLQTNNTICRELVGAKIKENDVYKNAMDSINAETSKLSTDSDVKLHQKTLADAKKMADAQIDKWNKYCDKVEMYSLKLYAEFYAKSSLYRLASTAIRHKMLNPLPLSVWNTLNAGENKLQQLKTRLIASKGGLSGKSTVLQNLFMIQALNNCRLQTLSALESTSKSSGHAGTWNNGETLMKLHLKNSPASKRESFSSPFLTMLTNRAYVDGVMLRTTFCDSQSQPLRMAFFLYDLQLTRNYNPSYKNVCDQLIHKYITCFNQRLLVPTEIEIINKETSK